MKIEADLKDLISKKKGNTPSLIMIFVLCKDNYRDISDMADWAFSIGANSVRFQLAHNDDAKIIELGDTEKRYVLTELEPVFAKYKDRMHINGNILFQLKNANKSNDWYDSAVSDGCFVGYLFSRIWGDGNISFCCIDKRVEHLKHRSSFEYIWKSRRYIGMRSAARSGGKENIQLKPGYRLIDKDCSHCGNYETNEKAKRFLQEAGLFEFAR
ncbi:MAG: hypothetical protein HGA85_04520 [Nanoarchaeota archaeon]|nr:hypothetical protein [Nanoarchaeota archaeon]